MARASHKTIIHASVEDVYGQIRNPHRWGSLFPGVGAPASGNGNGEVGTIARFEWMLWGRTVPITVEVTEDGVAPDGARWNARVGGEVTGHVFCSVKPQGGACEARLEVELVPAADHGLPASTIDRAVRDAARLVLERLRVRLEGARLPVEPAFEPPPDV